MDHSIWTTVRILVTDSNLIGVLKCHTGHLCLRSVFKKMFDKNVCD